MSAEYSKNQGVQVILPAGLPAVSPAVARGLLAILIELTEVPVLDGPAEGVSSDG
ncbi:hypothetical protein [Amycolatopsis sp. cmx-11-32]|uniref:hypothetical protein n=1 Tax=Amycolatopsis sp. cmx-11-32 TaxID=2785796 RepID=UPI0039E63C57